MNNVKELIKTHGKPKKEVYFDHENSGWVPPEVVEAMLPYFNIRGYGHPAITHKPGWEAYEVVYETKELIARTINADGPEEIIFTHSGTESNNLAILGTLYAIKSKKGKVGKVLVSSIEYLSVVFPAKWAEENLGFKVVMIPVDDEGFIDPDILAAYVDKDTVLVGIQLVNHEIGTIQSIKKLVEVVKEINPNVIFHTDAADAYGRVPIDVKDLNVDLLTLSSHKILGPKGVGALYVRSGIDVERIIHGQLSTESLWPGVENVPAIAGFKKAIELAFDNFNTNVEKMTQLRNALLNSIRDNIPHTLINGPIGKLRSPDNVNVSFLYVEGEAVTVELSLRGIYVSSGSACTSRYLEPSHVLLAIGRKHEEAHGSILFKVTRYHTKEDIEYTIEQLREAIDRLRRISAIKPDKEGER